MIDALLTKAFLAKAATVIAGLSLATTGAGAANVLPQVAQDRVAAAVEKASPLDLPDSHDAAGGTETTDKPEPADEAEKPEKAEKPEDTNEGGRPEKAKDNFGTTVSARAHSTEDKGRDFGHSVSEAAHARNAAKPDHEADDAADNSDDDNSDDDEAGEVEDGSSAAQSHRPADVPPTNRGSGHRP